MLTFSFFFLLIISNWRGSCYVVTRRNESACNDQMDGHGLTKKIQGVGYIIGYCPINNDAGWRTN